ncbi:uncharacterized protein LOC130761979 isoform X2 [Actinidia eriantha]|uniref:uncharacterized protein LOC130761979 isoform X2 n=1 Tax=Actinidia eriantha TaxID=165200 RepID=UPI00258ACD01|nr:uncharacterized protein LOC130761979 isoform X2 [Actinidia eriantha]
MAANTVSGGGASSAVTVSEDERSDQGAPTGVRKPPLPLQPVQLRLVDAYNLPSPDLKLSGGFNLPSPDSVASVASATSLSKHTAFQEPTHVVTSESRAPTIPNDNKATISDPNSQIQMQQYHDSSYMLLPTQLQHHHQQFVQSKQASKVTSTTTLQPPKPQSHLTTRRMLHRSNNSTTAKLNNNTQCTCIQSPKPKLHNQHTTCLCSLTWLIPRWWLRAGHQRYLQKQQL